LEATNQQVYTWPRLCKHVQEYSRTCENYQLNKKQRKKYGHLPPKEDAGKIMPWMRVNVDLIGPYKIKGPNDTKDTKPHVLQGMTMIDPVTGWFKIKAIEKPDANHHGRVLQGVVVLLSSTQTIGFDNGSKFNFLARLIL
jgi:hypothetical protein